MPYKLRSDMRDYQKNWRNHRRLEWMADKKCEVCGSTDRLSLLYRNPKAKLTHSPWTWAPKHMERELRKAQVFCWEHRLVELARRRGGNTEGGSAHGYNGYKRGCRCAICFQAKSEYERRWRQSPTGLMRY